MSGRPHSVCFMDRKNCGEPRCPIMTTERDADGLLIFHDIRFKGWNCPVCRRFNGEEKEVMKTCTSCETLRPTS